MKPTVNERILSFVKLFIVVLVYVSHGHADPQSRKGDTFDQLRASYLSLRNTDIDINRHAEWESLVDDFVAFAVKRPSDTRAPHALLNAAIMLDLLGRRFQDRTRSEQAYKSFGAIVRRYPNSALADDALLRQGDLAAQVLNDKERSRQAYEQLRRDYPASDMAAVAEARLLHLAGRRLPTDRSRTRGALVPRSPPAVLVKGRAPIIVLDPGHGGEDYGAVGIGGLLEKDLVLDVALRLEQLLVERLGSVVRLTRRTDQFVPLAERTRMANDFEADLFISIHANASVAKNLRGFEVYYLDNTDDAASRTLAERENASLQFEGPAGDLAFMLSDLIQSGKTDQSLQLAHQLNVAVLDMVTPRWPGMRSLGVKKAPFFVLVGAHMPCVLVELGFADHAEDGQRLSSKEFRADMAEAFLLGIRNFLER